MTAPLLQLDHLTVSFESQNGVLSPVRDASFELQRGERMGIVGESGSGKSMMCLSLMGLLPKGAKPQMDRFNFDGQDLKRAKEAKWRSLRGLKMGMVFQDPFQSINPSFTVAHQLREVLRHENSDLGKAAIEEAGLSLLSSVGLPDPKRVWAAYPHQLSGGQCQRVGIALAMSGQPDLLIADEPTTALDVTVQAQILDLLNELCISRSMALLLITHDVSIVGEYTDRVLVMYLGEIVESGKTSDVLSRPAHPYTQALLKSMPDAEAHPGTIERLPSIPGQVPDLLHRPSGCQLHPRCAYREAKCQEEWPGVRGTDRAIRCHFPLTDVGGETS